MTDTILSVHNLRVAFGHGDRALPIVKDVSFSVRRGETLCIVGESGCGKSVTAMAIIQLLPHRGTEITADVLRLQDTDLLSLSERQLRGLRGAGIAMIFQDPMNALNPLLTVGEQITEGIRQHRNLSRAEATAQAIKALQDVRIPDPERVITQYSFELSGGMRQRVMIAMALVLEPVLLIADEPTTALDATVQSQILALLKDLQKQRDLAVILITHDFGVVAEVADHIALMYAGRVIETAPVAQLFDAPQHPYTIGLMQARPSLKAARGDADRLQDIPGVVPLPSRTEQGCAFASRCPTGISRCNSDIPALHPVDSTHLAACHLCNSPDRRPA